MYLFLTSKAIPTSIDSIKKSFRVHYLFDSTCYATATKMMMMITKTMIIVESISINIKFKNIEVDYECVKAIKKNPTILIGIYDNVLP